MIQMYYNLASVLYALNGEMDQGIKDYGGDEVQPRSLPLHFGLGP